MKTVKVGEKNKADPPEGRWRVELTLLVWANLPRDPTLYMDIVRISLWRAGLAERPGHPSEMHTTPVGPRSLNGTGPEPE